MTDCDKKERLIIVQGDFTGYGDVDWLKLKPTSDVWDLATMHATFELNGIVKTFDDLTQPFSINYEAAETASMPLGDIDGILRFYDINNKPVTIDNLIPVTVVKYVHGDAVKTGKYEMNIEVKQGDEVVMEVLVEAGVSVEPGNTYTLDPGEPARIVNRGTASHLILDFYIPKGDKGEQGEPGEPGEQGIPGQPGADGKDATVNGVNTLIIEARDGLNLAQSGNVATLSGKSIQDSVTTEATNRSNADNNLQQQIDAITASSDVTDIVGTYAELQAYDTSSLPPNSIIKVLQDESRNNETTYYRWVITADVGSWLLIGEEGPYYPKSESDAKFVPQTRTINNKALNQNVTLSASDVGALPNNIYGTSTTAAATVQKEVSIPSITSLNAGQLIIVIPTETSTVANSTIKLNDFPAYPMLYDGVAITTSTDAYVWRADVPSWWLFDGSYWLFAGHGYDFYTTYSAMTVANIIAGTETTGRLMRSDYLKDGICGVVTAYASGDTITPADKYLYTSTADISALTVNAPTSPDVRYVSQINFSSGTTATTLSYPNTFKVIEGCDDVQTINGVKVFVPVASKRYQMFILNDGVNNLLVAKGV